MGKTKVFFFFLSMKTQENIGILNALNAWIVILISYKVILEERSDFFFIGKQSHQG